MPCRIEAAPICLSHTIGVLVDDELSADDRHAVKDLTDAHSRLPQVIFLGNLHFEFRLDIKQALRPFFPTFQVSLSFLECLVHPIGERLVFVLFLSAKTPS